MDRDQLIIPDLGHLPGNFVWGVATSAFQIEGRPTVAGNQSGMPSAGALARSLTVPMALLPVITLTAWSPISISSPRSGSKPIASQLPGRVSSPRVAARHQAGDSVSMTG